MKPPGPIAALLGLLGMALVSAPATAQIIAPGQTGQDLPHVPMMKPRQPEGVDRSWTLRHGKRPPPPRWERENGFAAPPAYGGPRDALPRSRYID